MGMRLNLTWVDIWSLEFWPPGEYVGVVGFILKNSCSILLGDADVPSESEPKQKSYEAGNQNNALKKAQTLCRAEWSRIQ